MNEIVKQDTPDVLQGILEGVSYIKQVNGDILLNLKDAAIGLGYEKTEQNKNGTERKSIRWQRVREIMAQINEKYARPSVGADTYISESDFYELALRATNEKAKAFQKKVFLEILPAIRKTGAYISSNATPEQIQWLLENQIIEFYKDGGERAAQRIRQMIDSKNLNNLRLIESFDYIYKNIDRKYRDQFIVSFKYAVDEAYNRALVSGGKMKKLAMESFRTKAELILHVEKQHHERDNRSYGQKLRQAKAKLESLSSNSNEEEE